MKATMMGSTAAEEAWGVHLLTLHAVEKGNDGSATAVLTLASIAAWFLFSIAFLYAPTYAAVCTGFITIVCVVGAVCAHYSGRNSRRDAELYENGILLPVSRWQGGTRFVHKDDIAEVEVSRGQFGNEPPNWAKGRWAMLLLITDDDDLHGTGWKGIGDVLKAVESIRTVWGKDVRFVD